MTCIVGLIHKETVYMGGDSLGSNGNTGNIYKNKKIFKLKDSPEILVGYTASYRMGQLLQYSSGLFEELALMKNQIDEEYLVNKFAQNTRKLFTDGGFGKDNVGGTFIISFKDKLYEVESDYSILEPKNGYCSVGSGGDFANASLFTTRDMSFTPQERIIKALEAAENFSIGVKRPFYIINSKNEEIVEVE